MPTADSFSALGKGNGFPFCLNKVDVSSAIDYIAWDLPTAMNVYWNLHKFNVNVSTDNLSISEVGIGDDIDDDYDHSDREAHEPHFRTCDRVQRFEWDDPNGGIDVKGEVYLSQTSPSETVNAYIDLHIAALYDGSVNDPDNFVGYGIDNSTNSIDDSPIGVFATNPSDRFTDTRLISYYFTTAQSDGGTWSVSTDTLGGVDFLKATVTYANSGQVADFSGADFYTYT
jgi:hypothetical protein